MTDPSPGPPGPRPPGPRPPEPSGPRPPGTPGPTPSGRRPPGPRPPVRTRPYHPADLPGCLDVFDSNVPRHFTEAERPGFEAFLRALPGPYLVVEQDGEIVGCGGYALDEDGRTADLCWGMVRQDLHGRGLGRALTGARLAAATADPAVAAIALNTSQHTRGFYEHLGFRVTSVEPDGYAPGLDRCELRMEVDR